MEVFVRLRGKNMIGKEYGMVDDLLSVQRVLDILEDGLVSLFL